LGGNRNYGKKNGKKKASILSWKMKGGYSQKNYPIENLGEETTKIEVGKSKI